MFRVLTHRAMDGCSLIARSIACRRGDRLLFRGVFASTSAGDGLHIAGPNGTGKSSLIRILAGLLRPLGGKVERHGAAGLLDERPALDEYQPLGQALAFWGTMDGAAEVDGSAADRLKLSGLLEVPVRYLSTGQRKRAALARLIRQRVPIWLLDEPLNGLDTAGIALVEQLIAEQRAGGGIVVVASHQPIGMPGAEILDLRDYLA